MARGKGSCGGVRKFDGSGKGVGKRRATKVVPVKRKSVKKK